MSTHCVIAQVIGKKIHAITCHYDGYHSRPISKAFSRTPALREPAGAGESLFKFYSTKKEVSKLIKAGNLNSLNNGNPDFSDEQDVNSVTFNSFESFFRWASKQSGCGEYIYLFDNEWAVYRNHWVADGYGERYSFDFLNDIYKQLEEERNDACKTIQEN